MEERTRELPHLLVPLHQVMSNLSPSQGGGRGTRSGLCIINSRLPASVPVRSFYWLSIAVKQTMPQLSALKKQIYFAHESAIWAGPGGNGSSLLGVASAGVTQQGAEGFSLEMAHPHGWHVGAGYSLEPQPQPDLWASVPVPVGFLIVWWSRSKSGHPKRTRQKCMTFS